MDRAIQIFTGTSSNYHRTRAQIRLRRRNINGANEDLNKSIQIAGGERDSNHEDRAVVREYLGDTRGAIGDAWWAVYYGERHGHGVAGLDMIRRLELDR
jgi:hypothetical protein